MAFTQLPFGTVQLQGLQGDQFHATQRFLLSLSTDTMLKPYRELAGVRQFSDQMVWKGLRTRTLSWTMDIRPGARLCHHRRCGGQIETR